MKIVFSLKNVIIGLLLCAVLFLYSCPRKKTQPTPKPEVVSIETIKDHVVKDTAAYQSYKDSTSKVIASLNSALIKKEVSLQGQMDIYQDLEQENYRLIAKMSAGELADNIKGQADKISNSQKTKDSLCAAIANNLKSTLFQKDKQLSESESLSKKIKNNLDTCLKNQAALQQYADKISKDLKPHNKLAIGVITNVYPVFGYGVATELILKNGYIFGGSVMQMNNQGFYQASIKKVISLRK